LPFNNNNGTQFQTQLELKEKNTKFDFVRVQQRSESSCNVIWIFAWRNLQNWTQIRWHISDHTRRINSHNHQSPLDFIYFERWLFLISDRF
jgi:hypothetical protein